MDTKPAENRSPHRVRLGGRAVLLAVASLAAFSAAFLASSCGVDVDINSGRQARTAAIGCLTVWSDEYDTPFSRLVLNAGWQPPPPAWRRAFTRWCPSGARINHRYGGIVTAARQLPMSIERLEGCVPPADQHRLATAAIRCMQRGEAFLVMTDADAASIQLVTADLKVIESYPAAADR